MRNLEDCKAEVFRRSEERIKEVCKICHAHNFIKRMPNGYDTVINEQGANLSTGQKQLLCIARVMLLKPPMLILDEATSSIDTRTEAIVQRGMDALMVGRTVFVIAHRLSTVIAADKIMVIEKGIITAEGGHNDLLAQSPKYKELYETQFKKILDFERNKTVD